MPSLFFDDSIPLTSKLAQFSSGHLPPADLLQDPELEAILAALQKELSYPTSLSTILDLSPFGLLKALNQGSVAILITDVKARIQYLNAQCERLTGYSQSELLGKTPQVLKSGQTPESTYREMWQSLNAGKSWSGELLNKRKNGSLYWEWASIAPILNVQGDIVQFVAIKQDITQRKLVESELKYQSTLLDSLSDAVISTDLEMNILSWNRAAETLYGWSSSETLGHNWLVLQPDCVFTGISRDEVFQLIMQKGMWSGKVIQHHALGHELSAFVVCSLVYNAQNAPAGFVLIHRDLSQHEALQRSLSESEARFKQVADNLEEAIWSVDTEQDTVEYMGPALARMSGLSYQTLLENPHHWSNFIHADDRVHYLECLQRLVQLPGTALTVMDKLEYRFRCPDGQEKWFSTRMYRSAQKKIWGITEDITLRKRLQEEMAHSEQFAYGILGALSAHICVLDQQGKIIATNEAWNCFAAANQGNSDYLGWNYLALCNATQGSERPQALAASAGINAVLADRESVFAMEYPCHCEQEQRWFELKVNRIQGDPEGRIVVFHQDITAQKRAQEALRRLNEHLEDEVELRTKALKQSLKELRQANQQLVEANRMKDAFLANMSHELRTPLTGILGMADLLSQQVLGPLNPKQAKSLQTLRDSGQHLLTLINDILDLSKVEAGKMELHPEWVEVAATAQQLLSMVKSMAEEKQIRLSLKVEPFDLKIWADPRSFKQILVNLLSNAIKFTPQDGIVSLETQVKDHGIVVTVSDTGIGIAEADLAKLFQPFVQIDSGLSRKYAGTGLGLTLVKNLIEAHGGYIRVESRPAQGSAFSLYFPLDAGERLSDLTVNLVSLNEEETLVSEQGPLILLVDDNPINIEVIESFLTYADYQVVSLSSGQEALLWLQTETPDLILMDIQMPVMSGFEVIEQIRCFPRPAVAALPVIALTSLAMTGDQEKILKQGFDNYLSKPVDFPTLGLMIKALLGKPSEVKTNEFVR